jgi:hypothetical protein
VEVVIVPGSGRMKRSAVTTKESAKLKQLKLPATPKPATTPVQPTAKPATQTVQPTVKKTIEKEAKSKKVNTKNIPKQCDEPLALLASDATLPEVISAYNTLAKFVMNNGSMPRPTAYDSCPNSPALCLSF